MLVLQKKICQQISFSTCIKHKIVTFLSIVWGHFGKMSAPMSHDRSRKSEVDEEEDPVEAMIKKTGCIEKHYKVQVN